MAEQRDSRGRFKSMDRDIKALAECMKALESCSSDRMRRVTLEYLWDKYVTHAKSDAA